MTARSSARRWERWQTAWLTDTFEDGATFRIQAENPDDETCMDVVVRREDTVVIPEPRQSNQRFYLDWSVLKQRGNNPNLTTIANSLINITGHPLPERQLPEYGPLRPYCDMIFLDGQLDLTLSPTTQRVDAGAIFNMGKVVGLTIVSLGREYPVWTPRSG